MACKMTESTNIQSFLGVLIKSLNSSDTTRENINKTKASKAFHEK